MKEILYLLGGTTSSSMIRKQREFFAGSLPPLRDRFAVSFARGFLSCGLLFLLSQLTLAHAAGNKWLIEFGWDEPDTAFMRQHIAEMEQTPFQGCVFHLQGTKTNGNPFNFTWQGWGTNAFTESDLKPAMDDLKATPFRRFQHNFLRFNTTPAKLDWFDDHSAVITNAWLAARVAKEGQIKGLLFDIEQYEGPLFDYRKQRDVKEKSWELYADKETPRWWSATGGTIKLPTAYDAALRRAHADD